MKNLSVSDKVFDIREIGIDITNNKTPYFFTIQAGKLVIPYIHTPYHICGFDTYDQAEESRKAFKLNNPWKYKYALVTESKAHQVFDSIYSELADAYDYVSQQEHNYFTPNEDGSAPYTFGANGNGDLYVNINFGIYSIQLVEMNVKASLIYI